MREPHYEIWGGDCRSLSFMDGGSADCLETCLTLSEAVTNCETWQNNNYAAHIRDIDTDVEFTPTDVRNGTVPQPKRRRKRV